MVVGAQIIMYNGNKRGKRGVEEKGGDWRREGGGEVESKEVTFQMHLM